MIELQGKKISSIGLLVILIGVMIMLFACTPNEIARTTGNPEIYNIVVIDNCEYIKTYEGYQLGYTFSHKGNCKFCKEREEALYQSRKIHDK